jgi:hypothetical protein
VLRLFGAARDAGWFLLLVQALGARFVRFPRAKTVNGSQASSTMPK